MLTAEVYDAGNSLLDSNHDPSTGGSGFEGSMLDPALFTGRDNAPAMAASPGG